jgi:heme/copper-type cytochrome/quinol oxidase subunit 4
MMGRIKQKAEGVMTDLLRRAGVPEQQLHARMRKTGRGFLLTSILFIIPLVALDNVPVAAKVGLQIIYGLMVIAGVLLAFDEEKPPRR